MRVERKRRPDLRPRVPAAMLPAGHCDRSELFTRRAVFLHVGPSDHREPPMTPYQP